MIIVIIVFLPFFSASHFTNIGHFFYWTLVLKFDKPARCPVQMCLSDTHWKWLPSVIEVVSLDSSEIAQMVAGTQETDA